MRKLLSAVFAVLLVFSFSMVPFNSVSAQIRYPMTSTYISADTETAIPSGKEIYGYTLIATAANAIVGLYNSTLGAASTSTVISELAEATSGNSQTAWFPKPIVTTADGCSVVVNNGAVVIYHQP